jgi:hypothetical protein
MDPILLPKVKMNNLINLSPIIRNHFEDQVVAHVRQGFNGIDGVMAKIVFPIFFRNDGFVLGLKLSERSIIEHKIDAPLISFLSFYYDADAPQTIIAGLDKGVYLTHEKSWNAEEINLLSLASCTEGLNVYTPDVAYKAFPLSKYDHAALLLHMLVASLNLKFSKPTAM